MATGGRRGGDGGTVDLSGYQTRVEKAAANGYAPLGADSKVPTLNLPASLGGGSLEGFIGGVDAGAVTGLDIADGLAATIDGGGVLHVTADPLSSGGEQVDDLLSIASFWSPASPSGYMTTGMPVHRLGGAPIPYAGSLVPDRPGRLGGRRILIPQVAANFTAAGATIAETLDEPFVYDRALRCTFSTAGGGTVKPNGTLTPFYLTDPTSGDGRSIHIYLRINRNGYAQSGGLRLEVSNDNFTSGSYSYVRLRTDGTEIADNFTTQLGAQGILNGTGGMGRTAHLAYDVGEFQVGSGSGADFTQPLNSIRLRGAGNAVDSMDGTQGPLVVDWLCVDTQPRILDKALCVIWMDDALIETWQNWVPSMDAYGFPGNVACIIPNVSRTVSTGLQEWHLHQMVTRGYSVGFHAWDNHDAAIAPGAIGVGNNLRQRFIRGFAWSNTRGFPGIEDGAYAGSGGSGIHSKYDDQYNSIRDLGFASYRNNITDLPVVEPVPVGDPLNLRAFMLSGAETVFPGGPAQAYLDSAMAQKGLAIFTTHPSDWKGNAGFTTAMLAYLDAHRASIDVVTMPMARRIIAGAV